MQEIFFLRSATFGGKEYFAVDDSWETWIAYIDD